ncbi:aryl hydrocarbon receptor-like isoform X2 [Solea senegalensis]|uniref:Aryl hydrocarbon receptor n=2 Tax=Solea senegalensis TaxID=28829 RepID=A0AAV6RBZ8_SOLSE|nr:aryl hydrocarbon receptor-like isoform X2 [Solea senegalensis]
MSESMSVDLSDTMLGNSGGYATKKRKKPVLKQKKISEGNGVVKSNPSKRHRDRLNGELDRLTELLPFSEDVRSRLDKLSVLRLSVGYLRVKSYFKATTKSGNASLFPALKGLNGQNGQNGNSADATSFSEGDLLLQALNGFVIVVTSDGLVFYASSTIKDYLGFHQSDVVHQSVYDLIHTDDRDLFREQLHFAMKPPPACVGGNVLSAANTVMYSPEQLPPENSSFLERTFVCRFRCLLDNSSGFLALKFQGRLKYLHGQSVLRDNQVCNKPQLALFTIAIPVQPPAIVEIRAKMLLFQTKHKLDFTPTGIDSRGKVVLGYSELEICMKGSGYQFIHAADMMYCADKHMRMIKTGETGLCVFRLLSKTNEWVWVKSNARLIYKGGRPEFIIANQRALSNAEGEEYLHRRQVEPAFAITTGEAVLYTTTATVDVSLYQFNKKFDCDMGKDVPPHSLLDCFLRQDESAYTQAAASPSPVDQVFMESHALVSIPSDTWQDAGAMSSAVNSAIVKEESKQSVMAVIDNLEKIAQNGDLPATLQNLEVSDEELVEWENALKRLGQEGDQQNSIKSDLDSILTTDIFDYIDDILFQENPRPTNGLTPGSNNHHGAFSHVAAHFSEEQMFKKLSPNHTFSPKNGLYAHQQDTAIMEAAVIFNGGQKLSHQGHLLAQSDAKLPPPQELQLQDIFSPSIEIPELIVPNVSGVDPLAPFQSLGQASFGHTEHPPGITVPAQNSLQAPAMAANGPMLPSSVKTAINVAPGVMDILPPLIPCKDLKSSPPPNIPVHYSAPHLQGSPAFDTHKVQQWPQSQQQQKLPHTGVTHNGHAPMPACNGQTAESQTFPHASLWQSSVTRVKHGQQGELTCGQAASHRGCIFSHHFSSSPAALDGMLGLTGSTVLRETDALLGQSPLQGSRCLPWGRGEPVAGVSAVNQENGNIVSASERALNIHHYQENLRQMQDERLSAELNGIFAAPPPHDVALYLAE